MIRIKNSGELSLMRQAGRIAQGALSLAGELIREGATTASIDARVRSFIEGHGATPSFLNYNGFPASCCISLNSEVIHGIPSGRKLKNGDIVKVDVGAFYKGFHGDCANTFPCGEVSEDALRLIKATRESFHAGFEVLRGGIRMGDMSGAIQQRAESEGFSVVRRYIGHGIGSQLHEAPDVPNYGTAGHGLRLSEGMTIAIEPMINAGGYDVTELSDGWTVVTRDGALSAHYENTVVVTENGAEILTAL